MKVGVIGAGYVGLSTAACLATKFQVTVVDSNALRVAQLKRGEVPIHEKGLEDLLARGLRSKRLDFSVGVRALQGSDAIFIAVGTPSMEDGSIDISQVRRASADVASSVIRDATNNPLVLVRSTVIPGTTRGFVNRILETESGKRCGEGFHLCSNPEFLREGTAIRDSLRPQRIVIGGTDQGSLLAARSLYRKYYGKNAPPIVETTPEGAELIKYASNSLLATKISFINLISIICELYPGTDVNDVARGIGLDPRIGHLFLQAGPGFGGSCFEKDLRAFSAYLKQQAIDRSMLEGVLAVNEFQPKRVIGLAEKKAGSLLGKQVAVLGLAFKAETDDVRGSRSIPLVLGLLARGAKVRVYDPVAMEAAKPALGQNVTYSPSAKACLEGADLAIAMTAWKQFRALKASDYAKLMRTPVLIDARRIYDPTVYSKTLDYTAVGLGETSAK